MDAEITQTATAATYVIYALGIIGIVYVLWVGDGDKRDAGVANGQR